MKKNLIKLFALSAMALVGWSCETDYYNENYLDGYESDDKITDVQQIEYTLAEGDYTTIARNATNQATAEAAGEEAKQALAAIGTNKYFANEDEAGMYIPAFIAASYPTLDDTSVAMVTYRSALEVPAEIGKMNAAKEYTLKKEDYQAIWGSETEFEQALTPATIGKLPEALAAAYATEEIAAGDYVVVTYNYSAEEPKAEEPEEPSTPSDPDEPVQPDEPTTNYTSILGTAVSGDAVEVKGWISAVSTMGPILTDNGGSVLLYDKNNAAFPALKVGDEVTVSGTMGDYKTGLQIAASGASVEVTGTKEVAYPTPTELTGEVMNTMKDRTENEPSLFIKATGTMKVSVSGDYTNYNLVVEGADGCQISFYGPTSEVIGQIVDGQTATLYGYLTGITGSSTKYFSTVAVSINEEPNFDEGGNEPEEPSTNYTSVLGTTPSGDAVEVKGWISAVSTMGPILTDNGGSVLLYDKNNAAFPALKVGDEVTVSGTMGDYKTGLQIAASGASVEVTGTKEVAYPTPTELTGEVMNTMKDRTENEPSLFIKATGTMKVSVSGDYTNYNLVVEGADGCQISFYGPTSEVIGQIVDGQTATLYGYLTGITGSSTKYFSTVAVKIETATASANVATALQSSKQYGFYQWDGAKFAAADVAIVQPEDYTEMGQNYGNFSNPAQDDYLPKFLAKNYPYGMEGDKVNVLYRCYAGGANSWRVDEYISNGSAWIKTIYFADMVGQFRKAEGVWKVDRTLELAYTEMGSADFKAFCQYCCNWVYDFVDVPLGAPARDNAGVILSADKVTVGGNSPSGAWWVSSYGNNEWYAGTYAYYGEMNWSGSKARAAWENLGYTGLSDDELIAKMQQNAAIVFQNVLGYMYPEMTPEEYNQVVIKVYDYISKANWAYTFKTVGTGTFEYVEGSLTKL